MNRLKGKPADSLSATDVAIVQATLREIASFAPQAAEAKLIHSDVHRIPMAVCCPRPGSELKRWPG